MDTCLPHPYPPISAFFIATVSFYCPLSAVTTLREVLIEKHFRGVTPRTICEYFWEQVNKHEFKQV